jgi:hypothetical protein
MARNIDIALKNQVAAVLRSRGATREASDHLASTHAAEARATFDTALMTAGGGTEAGYEHAFQVVSKWASKL